jgi:FtsH-binding integral membrane protein
VHGAIGGAFVGDLSAGESTMSKFVSSGIRRTFLSLAIGIIVTGLFVAGLVWMTSLRERGWSNDPKTFDRQMTFVVTLVAIVISAVVLNRALNRPRNRALASTTSDRSSIQSNVAEHPLHDRLMDG